jgi:Domain of unknown function (DUF4160)
VPTISRFHGIVISMYFKDHNPPHFHVSSGGRKGKVRIDPVEVIEGRLSRKQFALVKKWAELHQTELEDNWRRARDHETLRRIEPLR